jgi:hypothetical protein
LFVAEALTCYNSSFKKLPRKQYGTNWTPE